MAFISMFFMFIYFAQNFGNFYVEFWYVEIDETILWSLKMDKYLF